MKTITRFAPSPTGHLHIGGARTALFNWLFSRQKGGTFILRVEDTDLQRSTEEYTGLIIDALQWLGLDWDEGPYFQSKRLDLYREYAYKLLEEEKAYRCYCLPEELEQKRARALQEGKAFGYDNTCRNVKRKSEDIPFAIRFKTQDCGVTVVDDMVKRRVEFKNDELEDLVILRSDGTPTYNFTVVIDDALMNITHVIRGDDHLNNTPKQILLYEALGYPLPRFAHVSMILGADKTRLSKRHGATSVLAYRDMGYLPEALFNYLVRLGWSYKDQEIFSKDELIEKFSLENVGRSAGIFNPDKLLWLNSHYIKESPCTCLVELLIPFLRKREIAYASYEKSLKIVKSLKKRSRTLEEMVEGAICFVTEECEYSHDAAKKFLTTKTQPILELVLRGIKDLCPLTEQNLESLLKSVGEELGLKLVSVAQTVRVALTGKTASPGLFDVMDILGIDNTILRLKKAISYIDEE